MADPKRDFGDHEYKDSPSVPSQTYGFPPEAFDWTRLPDFDTNFLPLEHLEAFIQALSAPDPIPQTPDGPSATSIYPLHSPQSHRDSTTSLDIDATRRAVRSSLSFHDEDRESREAAEAATTAADMAAPGPVSSSSSRQAAARSRRPSSSSLFISARNDWAPVHERIRRDRNDAAASVRKRKTRKRARTKDETREGYFYSLLKWPLLFTVGAWVLGLSVMYLATRMYISLYEQLVSWRGQRKRLRQAMRSTNRYQDWVAAAQRMDDYFGNGRWKEQDEFAYYDSKTVKRVLEEMRRCRRRTERARDRGGLNERRQTTEDLKVLIEACVKNNFVGIENPRLYSQTYYGTKNLVQNYIDEVERSIKFLVDTDQLSKEEKRVMFKGMCANYGRTALCLSGGATFAYYHFGVVKALLEEDLLPDIITGTSGGALVAALVATRTNEELKKLLVPALAHRITACREPITVWFRRWWKTGARFDSVDWARQCSWWTRGSMTFREAYERTGRILNVSCVPSDPHSPTILCNYLTSPDCVIWSAVLASAAVPGILNPVVLMMKTRSGQLVPYSFGHKWKDGSLRTDIPVKALNLHFNVNFTIVSQVNPHINLFFFSSRGSVGQPVVHRRGRGWRGGYIGSAVEQYIKLDLTKWLRVLRQLELLPRPLGQDWSMLWLQTFGGTVTIWPKVVMSDFPKILTDPDPARLARMIYEGQQSTFPKMKFVANRLRIERLVEKGRRESRLWSTGTRPVVDTASASASASASAAAAAAAASASHAGEAGTSANSSMDVRKLSMESILSEDDLRSLLKERKRKNKKKRDDDGGGGGTTTETEEEEEEEEEEEDEEDEDETTDCEEGFVFDGDDAERQLGVVARMEEEPKIATPMGLAGADVH